MAQYADNVRDVLASLGIASDLVTTRSLVLHPEAVELQVAETDAEGRQHLLVPEAARAWSAMKQAAAADDVVIRIVSAFPSVQQQAEIVHRKPKGLALVISSASTPWVTASTLAGD
jgi:D-alanyl-D-alanine carboxypeptidase